MEICVFAETLSVDQTSYEILVRRILVDYLHKHTPTIYRLEDVIFRGKGSLLSQLSFNTGRIIRKHPQMDCVFIFVDADRSNVTSEKRKVSNKLSKIKDSYAGEIIIGVPSSNIEAWLLTDVGNINEVLGLDLSDGYSRAETIHEPKEEMQKIYSNYRRIVDQRHVMTYPEVINKLFSSINLDILFARSSTFKKLISDIRAATITSKD